MDKKSVETKWISPPFEYGKAIMEIAGNTKGSYVKVLKQAETVPILKIKWLDGKHGGDAGDLGTEMNVPMKAISEVRLKDIPAQVKRVAGIRD